MMFRKISWMLCLALLAGLLSGCAMQRVEARLDAVEDALENQADLLEDAVEASLRQKPAQPETKAGHREEGSRQPHAAQPALTAEDAEDSALAHAGLTREQVSWLFAEPDRDNGLLHYDVEFFHDRWEYDYEVHGDSGDILSFEKERMD